MGWPVGWLGEHIPDTSGDILKASVFFSSLTDDDDDTEVDEPEPSRVSDGNSVVGPSTQDLDELLGLEDAPQSMNKSPAKRSVSWFFIFFSAALFERNWVYTLKRNCSFCNIPIQFCILRQLVNQISVLCKTTPQFFPFPNSENCIFSFAGNPY